MHSTSYFTIRTSKQVLEFLPLNTWTEVVLIDIEPDDNGIYIATTEDKIKTRIKNMATISKQIELCEKVKEFVPFAIVGTEIDGKWYRGKLAGFNEFLPNDTRMELIDIGSIHNTKFTNLFRLPYYLNYDPLALPIKFKDGYIPKTTKLSVKPLFSDSLLYTGIVVVEVKCSNVNQQVDLPKCNNLLNNSNITTTQIITNDCDDDLSSYLSQSLRKNNFSCQPKSYNIPLINGGVCLLTFVENFNSVYVGKAVQTNKTSVYDLFNFNILLETGESTDKTSKNYPVVGDVVKVLSPEFGCLYRAKILKHNRTGTYTVFYIDYGNTEIVSSDVIYELDEELLKPGLAIKVGIGDLKSSVFTKEIKDMFDHFIERGKPFVVEFDEKSKDCLENVKLKDMESGSYINDSYIQMYLQAKSKSPKAALSIGKNTKLLNGHSTSQLTLKNNDHVFLKHFESMDDVYIIKDVQLFNNIMLNINQDMSTVPKTCINIGDIVKVSGKNNNYRGKIINVKDTSVIVQNIDFGNINQVDSKNIVELPDNLRKIPGLAIQIGIKEPLIKKSEKLMLFIMQNEKIKLYIEFDELSPNQYQEITLKRLDNSKNIFDEFLKSIKHSPDSSESFKTSLNQETENTTIQSFKSILLKNGDYCLVSDFTDLQNIHLCKAVHSKLVPDVYETHNFDIVLKTMTSEDCELPSNLAIGDFVKAYLSSYGHFCRAKITNIEDDNYHIICIDFGNIDIVNLKSIFVLSDDLKIVTDLPLRVSIEVPPNAKLNKNIEDMFLNYLDNNVALSIEFNKYSPNGIENVILKEVNTGNSVNKKVLQLLSVKVNEEVSKLLPAEEKPIHNCDTCIVTHFENVDTVYVSRSNNNVKTLVDITNSTDRIPVKNLAKGDIVKVFSPSLKDCCRAKVISIEESGDCSVFYVDFGSTEIVSLSNVFKLSDDLKKIPYLATKIGLSLPFSVKENEDISDLFSALVIEKELLTIEFDESCEDGLNNCVLKVISRGDCINSEVIELLSDKSDKSSEKNTNIELKINNIKSPDVIKNKTEHKSLKTEDVFLKFFQDLKSVFVGRASEHDLFMDMMKNINLETPRKTLNIQIGDIVKVLFEEIMHRAKVLKKKDQCHYYIVFIDFGHEMTAHIDDIFELPDEFKKIPGCVKVGLKVPPEFKIPVNMVKDYFHGLNEERLCLEYDESSPNGLSEATLIRKNNSDIINELSKIIDTPLDLNDYELNNSDTVFCYHFEDFNQIYACKGSKNNVSPKNMNLFVNASKLKDIDVKHDDVFTNTVNDVLTNTVNDMPTNTVNDVPANTVNDVPSNTVNDISTNTVNDVPANTVNYASTKFKTIPQNPKCYGTYDNCLQIKNGDVVKFVYGNNVDNILIKHLKLYNQFNHIFELLKNEKSENLKPTHPKMHEIVLVSASKLSGFCRAKVIGPSLDDNTKFKCSFIDLGRLETIPLDCFYELPSYYSVSKLPVVVNRVTLDGVTKNPNLSAFLKKLIGIEFILELGKSDRWYKQVTLKYKKNNLSLNQELQQFCNNSSVQRLPKKIIMPKDIVCEMQTEYNHPIKSGSSVCITHFEDADSIYIRDTSFKLIEDFNSFNRQLFKHFRKVDNNSYIKENINIEDKLVCVRSSINIVMYCRAFIIDKIGNEYNVLYVDYGSKELVEREDIFELPEQMAAVQHFAIKVKLLNMPPLNTDDDNELVKEYFKRTFIISNQRVNIEFNQFDPNGLNNVILKTEYYNKSIVEEIKTQLNLKLQNSKTTGQAYQNTVQGNSYHVPQESTPYPGWKINRN